MLKFILTGTGRCGTGWASKVLTSAGVSCGHEEIFGPQGWEAASKLMESTELKGDASWMATPFLDRLPNDVQIVHLVRHPKPTIDSFRRIGFFNPRSPIGHRPWARFARRQMPEAWRYDNTRFRAAHFYYQWDRWIEELAPSAIFHRVEDGGETLLDKLGIDHEGKEIFSDTDYNHRGGMVVSDIRFEDDLHGECLDWIREIAEDYGYEI